METKKRVLSVALSQEELIVILSYLKLPVLMGFNANILEGLSKDDVNIVMGVAERALIARSFLAPDAQSRFKVSDPIHALVGTCAAPEASLIINCDYPERPTESYFFHSARKMRVVHTVPMTAIHQFIAMEDGNAMMKSALSTLKLDNLVPTNFKGATLEEDVIVQARETAEQKHIDQAIEILHKGGLDQNASEEFVRALTSPILNATIVRMITGEEDQGKGFGLLLGKSSSWLLQPIRTKSSSIKKVSIEPATAKNIEQHLKDLM